MSNSSSVLESLAEVDLTVSWKANPNFRGTLNILTSCLGTLFLCVWKSVHIDITTPWNRGGYGTFLTKSGWMLLGVFAPEYVLLIAYYQLQQALRLKAMYRENIKDVETGLVAGQKSAWTLRAFNATGIAICGKNIKDVEAELKKYNWTLTHAFYAIMGGFVFDFSSLDYKEPDRSFLPKHMCHLVITPAGMRFLIEHAPELIPKMSKEELDSRSKADPLSRIILLGQITWFTVNCVSRLVQHLPLSLLEIFTISHAICSLLTYLMWWRKPAITSFPTVIADTPKARQMCALMMMQSTIDPQTVKGAYIPECPPEALFIKTSLSPEQCTFSPRRGERFSPSFYYPESIFDLLTNVYDSLRKLCFFRRPPSNEELYPWYCRNQSENPDGRDEERWKLASEAEREHKWWQAFVEDSGKTEDRYAPQYVRMSSGLTKVSLRRAAKPSKQRLDNFISSDAPMILFAALFGLPLLLGWHTQFPTDSQRTVWRAFSVVVAVQPLLMFIAHCVVELFRKGHSSAKANGGANAEPLDTSANRDSGLSEIKGEAATQGEGPTISGENQPATRGGTPGVESKIIAPPSFSKATLLIALALALCLLFMVERLYLLIEALMQLLYLPPAVYRLPDWFGHWPHIG